MIEYTAYRHASVFHNIFKVNKILPVFMFLHLAQLLLTMYYMLAAIQTLSCWPMKQTCTHRQTFTFSSAHPTTLQHLCTTSNVLVWVRPIVPWFDPQTLFVPPVWSPSTATPSPSEWCATHIPKIALLTLLSPSMVPSEVTVFFPIALIPLACQAKL